MANVSRRYQEEPSDKFLTNRSKALLQPLLFIDRSRCDMHDGTPRETFTIAGMTQDCRYIISFGIQ